MRLSIYGRLALRRLERAFEVTPESPNGWC